MKEIKKLAVLLADPDELPGLLPLLRDKNATKAETPFPAAYTLTWGRVSCLFLCFGVGKTNAAAAAMYVAQNGYDTAFNYGYSGGVSGVARGQLFVAERLMEHDFDLTPLGYAPCQRPGEDLMVKANDGLCERLKRLFPRAAHGTALTGDRFLSDASRRDELRDAFDGMTCDMESAALARVCAKTGVAFCSLRLVSDDAGQDAKALYRESLACDRDLNRSAIEFVRLLCEELG